MPFPNEHAARLVSPDKFDKFRRQNDAGGSGVDFIYGIKAGKSEIQAIRFDSSKFSVEQVHAWLDKHNKKAISVTPAKKTSDKAEFDAAGGSAAISVPVATKKMSIQYMEAISMDDILASIKENNIDPEEFLLGMAHEQEHTDDPLEMAKIALDHLIEHSDYYSRLKKVFKDSKDHAEFAEHTDLAWDLKREDIDIDGDKDEDELELEAFKAGTHTDAAGVQGSWTEKDLENMANSYNETQVKVQQAPVVLGHPAQDGSSPAYGWVKSLKHVGGRLFAVLHRLNPAFVTALKNGSYKNRSLSLYDGGEKDGWVRHIGFLGATAPAITGLQPQNFQDSSKYKTFEFKELTMATEEKKVEASPAEKPELVLMERNWLLKLIDKFKIDLKKEFAESGTPEAIASALGNKSITEKERGSSAAEPAKAESGDAEKAKIENKEKVDPGITATEKVRAAEAKNEAAAMAKENADLKAQVTSLSEQVKSLTAALANRENPMDSNRAFCEGLVKDGRLRPCDLEETVVGLNLRTEADKIKNFAEDSAESTVSKYKIYLNHQPKLIEFGEIIKNHSEEDMCKYSAEDFDKKVADRMKLTPNISYDSCYALELAEMQSKAPKAYREFMNTSLGMNFTEEK